MIADPEPLASPELMITYIRHIGETQERLTGFDQKRIFNCMQAYAELMKNKSHGGKREGAGAPTKEPTVVMRIPLSKVKAVKKLLAKK